MPANWETANIDTRSSQGRRRGVLHWTHREAGGSVRRQKRLGEMWARDCVVVLFPGKGQRRQDKQAQAWLAGMISVNSGTQVLSLDFGILVPAPGVSRTESARDQYRRWLDVGCEWVGFI